MWIYRRHNSRQSQIFEKMIFLVILLGSVAVAETTAIGEEYLTELVDSNKNLLLVNDCWSSANLNLSGLGIVSLGCYAFSFCHNVTSLDLSSNWIKEIPEGIFSTMPNLEHLSLANNDLGGNGLKGAFRGLANLKSLNMSHNPLSAILENESFAGLSNSCEICIGRSRNLRTITPLVFGKRKKLHLRNRTPAKESKNCPDSLDDRIETFEVERSWTRFGKGDEDRRKLDDEPYSDDGVKMCKDRTTVRFVDFSNVTESESPNCSEILINLNGTKLKIYDDSVTSFESRWFRIRNTSLNAIYLYPKSFENMTRDLLNDLPENIRFFSLQESDLERLTKGLMINEHLRGLDLSGNFIRFIEDDAFAGLKLTRLNLGYNPIVTLDYVPTLPETLLWLNLDFTGIREIPEKTFSRLKNLLSLSLSGNSIMELQPPGLDGLASLQWLNLAAAEVKNLRPGVFRNLSGLHNLDLSHNNIERLERGVFDGLGCLAKLDFAASNLSRLDRGSFEGLPDSLEALDLSSNQLKILEAGTFVGAPKFNLSLAENKIRRIETGVFDLPYLRYLDLRHNNLTTIDRGAAQRLGNPVDEIEVKLDFNPIERLESGALAGLPSTARVDLGMTPMKIIQAGVFDDH